MRSEARHLGWFATSGRKLKRHPTAACQWHTSQVVDWPPRTAGAGAVVAAPGVYLLGMQFMRRRKSALIDGAGDHADDLGDQLLKYLNRAVRFNLVEPLRRYVTRRSCRKWQWQ